MYQDALNSLGFLSAAGYQFFNITDLGAMRRKQFETGEFRDWLLLPGESFANKPQLVVQCEGQ